MFTTHGVLVQNIQLHQADIERPSHAACAADYQGQFLVSHYGSLGGVRRVCLVGVDGTVIRSYGGQLGPHLTPMYAQAGLAVTHCRPVQQQIVGDRSVAVQFSCLLVLTEDWTVLTVMVRCSHVDVST